MNALGLGLIGTGFMGKAHALAYRAAPAVFGDLPKVDLAVLCDQDAEIADRMAAQFGFRTGTTDWHALVTSPEVDVVAITSPNALHFDMALAAIKAGKHVHCEKPMSITLDQARQMEAAARAHGTKTMVGYNYTQNPAFRHAQQLIEEGAIGTPVHFRGWVDEDYQADPDLPWSWRCTHAQAGLGALGDLGCHLVSLAYGLMGPVESLVADTQIIHKTRPLPDGSGHAAVDNEDTASAIVRFSSGAQGTLCTSRSAWGRKNRLDWEVHGTKGMITYQQERLNELQLYQDVGARSTQGFRTILTGPDHTPYGAFCPAPGHQLGFGDVKTIEVAAFLRWIDGGPQSAPTFTDALPFEAIIHSIAAAATSGQRVTL